jgi:hypothetical protein
VELAARVPVECHDPLGHFLLHAKRGPDYQFAGAAAVLLRALGYPTRLVSGFYVSPENYNPLTQHTPVVREDLHFWAEVMLPSGDWLVIEPTPGYEVLGPRRPLSERLWAALIAVTSWAGRHAMGMGAGLVTLGLLGWRRREILDIAITTLWRCCPAGTWQQSVRRTLWLLQWRARGAGRPRRAFQTIPNWLRSAAQAPIAREMELAELTRMAEWAAYASDLAPPWRLAEVQDVCCRVAAAWTSQHWRRANSAGAISGV